MEPLSLKRLKFRAQSHDQTGDWPAEDLADLAAAGAMQWAVPREFGGTDLQPLLLHQEYEQIAAASLATALVLTQRDSAAQMIDGAESFGHRAELLTALAKNEAFATIGIAQLTTSRQGGRPSLVATP